MVNGNFRSEVRVAFDGSFLLRQRERSFTTTPHHRV